MVTASILAVINGRPHRLPGARWALPLALAAGRQLAEL